MKIVQMARQRFSIIEGKASGAGLHFGDQFFFLTQGTCTSHAESIAQGGKKQLKIVAN